MATIIHPDKSITGSDLERFKQAVAEHAAEKSKLVENYPPDMMIRMANDIAAKLHSSGGSLTLSKIAEAYKNFPKVKNTAYGERGFSLVLQALQGAFDEVFEKSQATVKLEVQEIRK